MPSVIILGGCGFIGRNLVTYLVKNGLATKIRVVDKQLPDLAGLSAEQLAIFKEKVEFKQANLAKMEVCTKAFDGEKFDFAINLAGTTQYGQPDNVYTEGIINLSTYCGTAAAANGVKRFIEVSTAQVYDKGHSDETAKIAPWTGIAKAKFAAETALKKLSAEKGLKLVIVRPAYVYGPGDITSITPRVICGAVYQHLKEKMEFLWDGSLKLNTVHVSDVCTALWHLCTACPDGEIYNLVDSGNTTQQSISSILESMFKIKASFMGKVQSKLITVLPMKVVAENVNEKHLKPWAELCKAKGIENTPLTPYLDEELLYRKELHIKGDKITKTGFTYKVPQMTEALLKEATNYFVENKAFPKGLF